MAEAEEIAKELEERIQTDIKHFKGNLPERYALAWHGYIAGLYEWNVLELGWYRRLVEVLPKTNEPDPIAEIFLGRDDDDNE